MTACHAAVTLRWRTAPNAREHGRKLLAVERLRQEAVHAGGEAGVAIFGKGIGGERDDRRAARAVRLFRGADAPRRLDAVEARHVHIHQHQIIGRAGGSAAGQDSIAACRWSRRSGDGRARQQRARQQRVDLVVLRDQDRQTVRRSSPAEAARRRPSGMRKADAFGGSRAASEAARTGLTR